MTREVPRPGGQRSGPRDGGQWRGGEGRWEYRDLAAGGGAGRDRRGDREGRPQRPAASYERRYERPREDRPREDRPREDRPRDDRPRHDRPRSEDRPRHDRPRDDRPREDRPRDDRAGDDRTREDWRRQDRPRYSRDAGGDREPRGPELDEEISARDLNPEVRAELSSLARPVAQTVARRLVAVGLAAYHAGQWQLAIAELRAYHRMSGRQTHLAVLADSERALGRPERAIDIFRNADRSQLDQAGAVELLIVAAGARRDLGQLDAAVAMLQVPELTSTPDAPWAPRLRYAYADALLAAGRRDEAREWFARAAEVDDDLATDAVERLLDLDGVVLDDFEDDIEEDVEDDDVDDETGDAADETGDAAEEVGDAEAGEAEDHEKTEGEDPRE